MEEDRAKFDFKKELDAARTVRDELRLKAHLAKADIRDEFHRLEALFVQIEEDVRRVGVNLKEPAETIGKKSSILLRELTNGFEAIRRRLNAVAH